MANENSNSGRKKGWEKELLEKIYAGKKIPEPEKSLREMISDAQTLMYNQEANDIDRFCEISDCIPDGYFSKPEQEK